MFPQVWDQTLFLKSLNAAILPIAEDKLLKRGSPEAKDAGDFAHHQFDFTKPVGVIYQGPCHIQKPDHILNLVKRHLEARPEFKNNKTAIVLPKCCGHYSTELQALIRQAMPEIEFVFPRAHDYCENLDWMSFANDLLVAGLIRIVGSGYEGPRYVIALAPSRPAYSGGRGATFAESHYIELDAPDDKTAKEQFQKMRDGDDSTKRPNPDLLRYASLYRKIMD